MAGKIMTALPVTRPKLRNRGPPNVPFTEISIGASASQLTTEPGNMVARQGYAAGFSQGQADAGRGKKFKPTESDAYEHAKIPKGMDKDRFKLQFRESFVKGYSNGFKGE